MVIPSWSWLLTRWSLEPSVIAGMVALSAAYLYGCSYRPASRKPATHACSRFQLGMFWTSQAVLGLALMSPLDYVSDNYLFSAHMIQHLVLAAVWPALLLLSLPEQSGSWLYSRPVRSRLVRWIT